MGVYHYRYVFYKAVLYRREIKHVPGVKESKVSDNCIYFMSQKCYEFGGFNLYKLGLL